jgi:hypothetical protein
MQDGLYSRPPDSLSERKSRYFRQPRYGASAYSGRLLVESSRVTLLSVASGAGLSAEVLYLPSYTLYSRAANH